MRLSLLALVLVGLVFFSGCAAEKGEVVESPAPGMQGDGDSSAFTMGEIAKHNTEDDCWLVIGGKVYDVTGFIPSHPGGSAILEGCGKDATELFETRPMGSGTPHSQNARNRREGYYAGELEG